RMKKMGRAHRPFFRICAIDKRSPRDGRVIEELGTYDPMIVDTDARTLLDRERIDYWLSVGAQPSEKVAVLLKKYGTGGTHVGAQQSALDMLAAPKAIPDPGAPASLPKKPEEAQPEAPAEAATAEAPAASKEPAAEAPTAESATKESATDDTATEEKPAEEKTPEEKAPEEPTPEAPSEESAADAKAEA
ncbi:30S ribosomal protein S16, partial [Pirellulales bacterium]|nr:30S ribosomal protein S16 [Pirellulales bacterium]